jgi:hypothetical protein
MASAAQDKTARAVTPSRACPDITDSGPTLASSHHRRARRAKGPEHARRGLGVPGARCGDLRVERRDYALTSQVNETVPDVPWLSDAFTLGWYVPAVVGVPTTAQ